LLIAEFPTYGYRRICARLRRRETLTVNRKQVYQLMREQRWTVPQRQASPKPRVQQARSRTERSNERWEMDIAHVACGADGWGHLVAVIDCTTARVWAGSSPCADGPRKRSER
jgi:putative transposase